MQFHFVTTPSGSRAIDATSLTDQDDELSDEALGALEAACDLASIMGMPVCVRTEVYNAYWLYGAEMSHQVSSNDPVLLCTVERMGRLVGYEPKESLAPSL